MIAVMIAETTEMVVAVVVVCTATASLAEMTVAGDLETTGTVEGMVTDPEATDERPTKYPSSICHLTNQYLDWRPTRTKRKLLRGHEYFVLAGVLAGSINFTGYSGQINSPTRQCHLGLIRKKRVLPSKIPTTLRPPLSTALVLSVSDF